MASQGASVLKMISQWKLDASSDDIEKYYFPSRHYQSIRSGERNIVIGRKGSGKTAIANHIANSADWGTFVSTLSFKDFPFGELYRFKDERQSQTGIYITIWKYIIYSNLCWMLSRDNSASPHASQVLNGQFNQDPRRALSNSIREWVEWNVSSPLLGVGVKAASSKADDSSTEISDKVDILEEFLRIHLTSNEYVILFDELHEDYAGPRSMEDGSNYFVLLRGLIRAVQGIRSALDNRNVKIVVFLRDDIYDIVNDADKNKWSDHLSELTWSRRDLEELIRHRIGVVETGSVPPTLEDVLKTKQSRKSPVSGRYDGLFEYMLDLTHNRPRDIVKMMQLSALEAVNAHRDIIDTDDITRAGISYSTYLRQEIVDEVHPILPNLDEILDSFAGARKNTYTSAELTEKMINSGVLTRASMSSSEVFQIMYYFNIIGAVGNTLHFRYMNRSAKLVLPATVVLHPGLRRSVFF